MVPERLHLTEIVFGNNGDVGAIRERLKHASFDSVAKSFPADGVDLGFADRGWFSRDQLTDAGYAAAAPLAVGGTAEIAVDYQHGFVHVEEVREQMTCDQAIARYPDDEWAYTTRGSARFDAGDRAGAIADYTTLIGINPKTYEGHYGRAYAYYVDGKYKEALDDINSDMAPSGRGDADMLRGLIQEARGDDDLATASEAGALAQYHGRGEDESWAQYALGLAYENLGYFGAAIDEFDIVLKKTQNSDVLASRAFAWFAQGNVANAETDFRSASRVGPTLSRPYLGFAVMSFARGDATSALRYAQHAFANDPHDVYAALWVLVCKRALRQTPQLARGESLIKSAVWPAAALKVFLGFSPATALEAAASSPDPFTHRIQLCEARFYGAVYMLANDSAHALPRLRLAAAECPYREYERTAAEQLLRLHK